MNHYTTIYAQDSKGNLNLAYEYLHSGNTSAAIQLFNEYLANHPDDLRIYLQLAYAYKQTGNKDDAKYYFTYVANNSNDNSQIKSANEELNLLASFKNSLINDNEDLNYGYSLINKGNIPEAIDIFEKYKLKHPNNISLSLQLGYLYNNQRNYKKALEEFEIVKSGTKNNEEKDKASESIYYLKDMLINNSNKSTDLYFNNLYDSYQDNYISNLVGHINFKLWNRVYAGPYADVYMDSKSRTDRIYNDRYVEAGAFFKYRLTDFLGFELRTGYVNEIDFNKSSINFKPILNLGTRFGNPLFYSDYKRTKSSFLYLDAFSTSLYDYKFRNFFGQLQLKEVFRYLTGGYSFLEFYTSQMILADSKQLDYNNYAELGGGLTFKPNFANFPVLFVEATNKTFFVEPNGRYFTGPYKNTFQIKAGFLLNLKTLL
jgi:hypothetical protein